MKDIVSSLKLSSAYKTFRTSCFRKNLFYDVYYQNLLDQPFVHLKKFIQSCLSTQDEDVPKVIYFLLKNIQTNKTEYFTGKSVLWNCVL